MAGQQNPNMPYGGVPQQRPPVGMPPQAMPPYQGGPFQGVPSQGVPQQGGPYRGGPYQGAPYQGGPYQGVPPRGVPYQGAPYQGVPYQAVPFQGVPPQSGPFQGAPYQGVPFQGVQQPYGAAQGFAARQPQVGTPNPADKYRGFSIGAVVTIIGAVIVLSSFAMVWFVAKDAGIGHNPALHHGRYRLTRYHFLVAAAAIGLLILAGARLLGKFSDVWVRITVGLSAVGVLGAVLSVILGVGEHKLGPGVYVALVGSLIAGGGGLLMAIAKK